MTNFLELRKSTKISEISIEEINNKLLDIVMTVYVVAGQHGTASDADIKVISSIFAKDLQSTYKNLTMLEVEEFMNRGVRGAFGEYFGLSILSFNNWAKAFINLPDRADAIRNGHLLSLPKPEKPSDEQLKKIADESIAAMISHYKRTGEVLNLNNSNFRTLWDRKEIRFDDIKKKEYLDKAETIVGIKLQTKLMAAKQEGRRHEVAPIEKEIEDLFHGDHADIKLEAGKLAIEDWLKGQ